MNQTFQRESRARSLIKGMTWRIVASATIVIIAYAKTGDATLAIEIGIIEFIVKYLLYYFHERAWQHVPRGSFRNLFKNPNSQTWFRRNIFIPT